MFSSFLEGIINPTYPSYICLGMKATLNSIVTDFCGVYLRANWVIVDGTKYQTPCVLIVGKTEEEDLIFGKVLSIFIPICSF